MWTCPKCGRIFKRRDHPHSCKRVALESHFEKKELAKELYDFLLAKFKKEIGEVKEISLPCCVHWFGTADFIALLPKKDKLEIRFALNRELDNPRIKTTVPLSKTKFKHQLFVEKTNEIDSELFDWLKESYSL